MAEASVSVSRYTVTAAGRNASERRASLEKDESRLMSEMGGHSRPNWAVCIMSGSPPIATVELTSRFGSFVPLHEVAALQPAAGARAERPAARREDSDGEVARSTRSAHVLSACNA